MKTRNFSLFVFLFLASIALLPAQSLNDFKVCERISDEREPVNTKESYAKGTTVYAWINAASEGKKNIKVNWYNEGELKLSYPLSVGVEGQKSTRYRTWSKKTLHTGGAWKAEVVDELGKVIKTVEFQATE